MVPRLPSFAAIVLIAITAPFFTGCKTIEPVDPGVEAKVNDSGGVLMPEQAAFDVQNVGLDLKIDPENKFIVGSASVEVEVVEPMSWLVLDLDPRLEISSIAMSGNGSKHESALFERRGGKLWIFLGERTRARRSGCRGSSVFRKAARGEECSLGRRVYLGENGK